MLYIAFDWFKRLCPVHLVKDLASSSFLPYVNGYVNGLKVPNKLLLKTGNTTLDFKYQERYSSVEDR